MKNKWDYRDGVRPPTRYQRPKATEEQLTKARKLLGEGHSRYQAARIVGISQTALQKYPSLTPEERKERREMREETKGMRQILRLGDAE